MSRFRPLFALALCLALAIAWQWFPSRLAQAATRCVNPGGTGGCYNRIQLAVDAAGNGDQIVIAAGTYTETVSITKTLSLQGAGAAATVLDGGGNGVALTLGSAAPEVRPVVGVAGLTVRNGSGNGFAGGIVNYGTLTLAALVVSGNTAGNFNGAGGIYNAGVATLTGVTVTQNTGPVGAGILNAGSLVLASSVIIGNTANPFFASGNGGGISNSGAATLTNTTVAGNIAGTGQNGATSSGGGIESSAALTIRDSTISGNSVTGGTVSGTGSGGGIESSGTLSLTNVTISGNTVSGASTFGGGLRDNTGNATLLNVTFWGNAANGSAAVGGGIAGAGAKLKNTLIAASTGGNCGGFLVSQGHNLSGDSTCATAFNKGGDQNGVSDPKLGPLQDNGGGTQTHALLPYSPAINAGDNNGCPGADQRGVARPQGPLCDIGAYEIVPPMMTLSPPAQALQVGSSGALTVTLGVAQTTDTTIALGSSNMGAATVPASVVVPALQTSATFAVAAVGAGAATVTATLPQGLAGTNAAASVTVNSPPTATPTATATPAGVTPRVFLPLLRR
jgi:hypothetical protein